MPYGLIQEMEQLFYKDRLRKLGLSSFERRLQGDPIMVFQYLKEGYKKEGDILFNWVC